MDLYTMLGYEPGHDPFAAMNVTAEQARPGGPAICHRLPDLCILPLTIYRGNKLGKNLLPLVLLLLQPPNVLRKPRLAPTRIWNPPQERFRSPANCPMSVSPAPPSSGGAPPPISRSWASADLMVPTTSG